eukprot:GHUV01034377.1.p3 GENE.GHUV01034377.1~~GHUV01034377.1.p3  ORF type:complete len:118 (+),score=19.58 GHUV01034377.1:575-928(+)
MSSTYAVPAELNIHGVLSSHNRQHDNKPCGDVVPAACAADRLSRWTIHCSHQQYPQPKARVQEPQLLLLMRMPEIGSRIYSCCRLLAPRRLGILLTSYPQLLRPAKVLTTPSQCHLV